MTRPPISWKRLTDIEESSISSDNRTHRWYMPSRTEIAIHPHGAHSRPTAMRTPPGPYTPSRVMPWQVNLDCWSSFPHSRSSRHFGPATNVPHKSPITNRILLRNAVVRVCLLSYELPMDNGSAVARLMHHLDLSFTNIWNFERVL